MARDTTLTRAAAAGLAVALLAGPVGADPAPAARTERFAKTDAAAQSGAAQDAGGAAITAPGDPFAFPKLEGKVRSVAEVAVILTMGDGDTGPGEVSEGTLTLALDGIDTGLVLDGFRDGQVDTVTVGGRPANAAAIAAALRADGELAATIVNADPAGNPVTLPADTEAVLTVAGKARARR